MQITELRILRFRSIYDVTISFDQITSLMGGNNCGKSSILRALEIFFEAAPKIDADDFYNRGEDDIEITVTFGNLTNDEKEEFKSAVYREQLVLKRVISQGKEGNLRYEARAKSYPGFGKVRTIGGKRERTNAFNELASDLEGLAKASSADDADKAMEAWEAVHPDELEDGFRRDFFGATNIANGKLRRKTSLHLIQAVSDASEETSDPKRSPIISLLSAISKQIYENKSDVAEFISKAREQFSDLTDPNKVPELMGISAQLTESLKRYYPNSELLAEWNSDEVIQVEYPHPAIQVVDQGFKTSVENVGHGLQRACLFAIIQYLAQRQMGAASDEQFSEAQSDIILLIEEPEIYQHPSKQLAISEAFEQLCTGFNRETGIRVQVIFSTHSEKFVKLERFHTARIIRRQDFSDPGANTKHTASSLTLGECSSYFAGLLSTTPMSDEAFAGKLHIFSREVCEGFFADRIALVEGVTDKAVLEAFLLAVGRSSHNDGLAIINVGGKNKLDKPLYIFRKLGIPTFVVFDNDDGKPEEAQVNRRLQAILEVDEPEDYPAKIEGAFCALNGNLELCIKEAMGAEAYEQKRSEIAGEYGLKPAQLDKSPSLLAQIIGDARAAGIAFPQLEEIFRRVDELTD